MRAIASSSKRCPVTAVCCRRSSSTSGSLNGPRVIASAVTLKGDVDTMAERQQAEKVAAATPNVSQVVNELKVKKSR